MIVEPSFEDFLLRKHNEFANLLIAVLVSELHYFRNTLNIDVLHYIEFKKLRNDLVDDFEIFF